MKRILLLILTLFLFFACYIIYQSTNDNTIEYVLIGDELVNNPYIIRKESYKNNFVNNDYRIIDLLRILKYNEEMNDDGKRISIHQQLNKADVLIISIGTNEITNKLKEDTRNKYNYANNIIHYLEELFRLINQYDYKEVFFLGYNHDNNIELFDYLNWNVEKITKKYDFEFIKIDNFGKKSDLFTLNDMTYRKIYNFIVEKLENC